jgi:integrase
LARKQKRIRVERGLYRAGKTYYACATRGGATQADWKTLGEVGLMEARRQRDDFAVETRQQQPLRAHARNLTIAALAAEWLQEQRDRVGAGELTQRTYDGYESGLRLHSLPTLGQYRVSSIGPSDLANWNREQLTFGFARDSIRAWWTPLRLLFAYAARHRIIATSPADQLLAHEKPKAGKARSRFLSREEMDALITAAPERYELAIMIGLFAGLRLSEVLGLTWADIDLTRGIVHVEYQMGRDGKRRKLKTPAARRDVVLMEQLGRRLKRHRLASPHSSASDLVFATASGRSYGHRNLTGRGLEKARQSADLNGVTFHTLRHTFASLLIAQGRDPVFVASQLGHTNPAVTLRVYSHLFDAARHAKEARDALDNEFGALLSRDA